MTFFNASEPLIRCKQEHLDVQDRDSPVATPLANWKYYSFLRTLYPHRPNFSALGFGDRGNFFYGSVFPHQLELSGDSVVNFDSNWYCGNGCFDFVLGRVERVSWILYSWAILMITGLVLTDCSIFAGWGGLLLHLCDLWLGLSAIGYFCTGVGLRSRTFLLMRTNSSI